MFNALRQNSLFYILDKNNTPTLKIAQVISVSSPQYYGNINPTVDVTVKYNGENLEFKQLPANMNIANSNNVVVSESKDAMCTEVESMIKTSQQIIDSIDYHKTVIEKGDEILAKLNPRFAKEKEQEIKIKDLESKVGNIEQGISDMKTMMSELLNKTK